MIERKMTITTGFAKKDIKKINIDEILKERSKHYKNLKQQEENVYSCEFLDVVSETFTYLYLLNFAAFYNKDYAIIFEMDEDGILIKYSGKVKFKKMLLFKDYKIFDEIEVHLMSIIEDIFEAEELKHHNGPVKLRN